MSARRESLVPPQPALSPRLKWRAITLATLVLVPGFWALLTGLVAAASDGTAEAPDGTAALAVGLVAMPFAFIVLAWVSRHARPPREVLRAMGLALLVCVAVSAIALDAVTGLVAGMGAGGAIALRADIEHSFRARAIAVFVVTLYTFVLVRTVGAPTLLAAPVFPFTALGIADHLAERRASRAA